VLPGNVWIHATLRDGRRADGHGLWSGSVEIRNLLGARRRRTKSRSDAVAFTIPAMSSTKTPAQIKANYVALMGPQAGEAFAELMQDAARLHLKWNEFLALFALGSAQIDTLNKAAPGVFYLVSEAWWSVVEQPNPTSFV
jgi:hypothetical protein